MVALTLPPHLAGASPPCSFSHPANGSSGSPRSLAIRTISTAKVYTFSDVVLPVLLHKQVPLRHSNEPHELSRFSWVITKPWRIFYLLCNRQVLECALRQVGFDMCLKTSRMQIHLDITEKQPASFKIEMEAECKSVLLS